MIENYSSRVKSKQDESNIKNNHVRQNHQTADILLPNFKNKLPKNATNKPAPHKPNKISIFHQNIQHLPSRIDSLGLTLEELDPDFVAISEHKISKYQVERVRIENYKICSFFARENPGGGGVMLLAKHNTVIYDYIIPKCQELLEEKVFEFCMLKFKNNESNITLVCFYRSPIKHNEEVFLDKLEKLLNYC